MTEQAQSLLDAIGGLPPERFAVLDGALFDDLPTALADIGLAGRPLYFEGVDAERMTAGPFIVRLGDYGEAQRVLALIGDRRTGVFWSSPAGIDLLYRHLRKLNMVQIARVDDVQAPSDYQTVLFRHADPAVIAVLVAVMEPMQKSELLGQSPAIVYCAGPPDVPRVLAAAA